ncbi:hypothetical protein GCM10011273_18380 [Asticcacaulis endophyticus]|uniref:Uncharacterized protein n=1 Tax=Asticcacaulis endophyticus TaxID=1395890 RepID=A0A918Q430_9CAUL|nr:hypothetical protein GCM10011273_18380 [Asticcacaulis endophyticus]
MVRLSVAPACPGQQRQDIALKGIGNKERDDFSRLLVHLSRASQINPLLNKAIESPKRQKEKRAFQRPTRAKGSSF